jgi:hypothetical protein
MTSLDQQTPKIWISNHPRDPGPTASLLTCSTRIFFYFLGGGGCPNSYRYLGRHFITFLIIIKETSTHFVISSTDSVQSNPGR